MSRFSTSNPNFDEEAQEPRRKSIEVHANPTIGVGGAQIPAAVDFDDVVDVNDLKLDTDGPPEYINMWAWENIGLYTHYAAVGLLLGVVGGTARAACVYVYDGPANYCANITSLVFLAWNLKIFYAVVTDTIWPFGLRRKPYLIFGWTGVMVTSLIVTFFWRSLNAESFGLLLVLGQTFFMIGNVPADGYCVELAEFEPKQFRGNILATGQALRFTMGMVSNLFQSFLLNGPETNPSSSVIALTEGWTWGLDLGNYFLLFTFLLGLLVIPIFLMKEISSEGVERRSAISLLRDMWGVLQNKTALYLIIYGALMRAVAGLVPVTYFYTQYNIIGIPNLLSGIESMMAYLLLTLAVVTFKKYLINRNWRMVNYFSEVVSTAYSFIWFLPFNNIGGLRNGWFTVFISFSGEYIESLTQVLLSVAVIEIAEKGMEATTYELIVSITNSCITLATIIATQLASPFDVVPYSSGEEFDAADGPTKYMIYTSAIQAISITGLIIATRFLPVDREMCHKWREEGEAAGKQTTYGIGSVSIAVICVGYGLITSFFLFNPELSCLEFVGGGGCD